MSDIHDIITRTIPLEQKNNSYFIQSPWFWSLYSMPLLAFLFLAVYKKQTASPAKNSIDPMNIHIQKLHSDPGLNIAENFLKLGDHTAFYQEIIKAIWRPVHRRWPDTAIVHSREASIQQLKQTNLSSSLCEELIRLTQACETALYSPDKGTLQMHQVYSDSLRFLQQLENQKI